MDVENAKALVIEKLRRDAALHRQGRYKEIGEGFDDLDDNQPLYEARGAQPMIGMAWNFWEAWIDEAKSWVSKFLPGHQQGHLAKSC